MNAEQQEITPTISEVATQGIITPDSLSTLAPTTSQESPTTLNKIDICPSARIVPLEKLGLPAQFRLIT